MFKVYYKSMIIYNQLNNIFLVLTIIILILKIWTKYNYINYKIYCFKYIKI